MSIDKQNKPNLSHVLAIDFGRSKVGLAFSEIETKMAFPLETILVDGNFLDEIKRIIEEKEIDLVILGKPTWIEKKPDWKYEKLVDFVRDGLGVEVKFVDEMFTSKMAQNNLKEAGKKEVQKDDAEAARIILQEWLDKNLNN